MTDMPERIWADAAIMADGKALAGEWNHQDTGNPDDVLFIRADLVAAKDLEIETLAEAALRDMREIARLRGLLKQSLTSPHPHDCGGHLQGLEWSCTCGRAEAQAYFKEIGE